MFLPRAAVSNDSGGFPLHTRIDREMNPIGAAKLPTEFGPEWGEAKRHKPNPPFLKEIALNLARPICESTQ